MKNLFKKNQLMITALAIMIAIAGYLQFAGTNLEEDYLTTNDDGIQKKEGDGVNDVGSNGVITENLTAGSLQDSYDLEGLLDDLSEEDISNQELLEIESLDSDVDVLTEDYLEDDMDLIVDPNTGELTASAENTGAGDPQAAVQPDEDEIPGEAVFTSTNGIAVLSEAKLLKEQTRAKNKETLMEIINSTGLSEEQKQEAVNNMVAMTDIAEKESAAEILLEAKGFADAVVSIHDNAVDVVVNAASLTDAQRAQIEDIVKRKTEIPAENIVISTIVSQD